jgi:transposase
LPPERRGYRLNGKIDPYIAYLQARLAQGCTNQSRLWREIHDQGFSGTRSRVGKWIRTHASQPVVVQENARPQLPSAKSLSWLVFRATPEHDEDEQALWRQVCAHPVLAQLHDLIQEFREMVRQRRGNDLDAWLSACRSSGIPELGNFVDVLQRDYDAVKAGLTQPWSTGPVEGHVNRLKLIKRSAYGRMHVDLLRQRVLHAA